VNRFVLIMRNFLSLLLVYCLFTGILPAALPEEEVVTAYNLNNLGRMSVVERMAQQRGDINSFIGSQYDYRRTF